MKKFVLAILYANVVSVSLLYGGRTVRFTTTYFGFEHAADPAVTASNAPYDQMNSAPFLHFYVYYNNTLNAHLSIARTVSAHTTLQDLSHYTGQTPYALRMLQATWKLNEQQFLYVAEELLNDNPDTQLSSWNLVRIVESPTTSQRPALCIESDVESSDSPDTDTLSALQSLSDDNTSDYWSDTESNDTNSPETLPMYDGSTHVPQEPTGTVPYYYTEYYADSDTEDPVRQTLDNKKDRGINRIKKDRHTGKY